MDFTIGLSGTHNDLNFINQKILDLVGELEQAGVVFNEHWLSSGFILGGSRNVKEVTESDPLDIAGGQ